MTYKSKVIISNNHFKPVTPNVGFSFYVLERKEGKINL